MVERKEVERRKGAGAQDWGKVVDQRADDSHHGGSTMG